MFKMFLKKLINKSIKKFIHNGILHLIIHSIHLFKKILPVTLKVSLNQYIVKLTQEFIDESN
jgi:hypothetical protein